MKNYFIPHDYLSLFFNPLMRSGLVVTFSVSAPLLDNLRLCNISFNKDKTPEIHDIINYARYSIHARKLTSRTRRSNLADEIPEYGNFQDAFFNSAVFKPTGLDQVFTSIEEASTQSVIRGGDVYYLAFDTNVLRDRIYTNFLRQHSDAPNIDFILTETVRFELTNRGRKISKKMVNDLRALAGETGRTFLNQNVLADRLRYIGFLEYNRIRHETDCDQLKAKEHSQNKDEEIIKTYAAFAEESRNRKLLLISRDNEFIRMSTSLPNVIPVIIASPFPKEVPESISCTYGELFSFIYHLAVIYGQIDFSVKEHTIYECAGVWPQKNVHQWESDFLKMSAHHGLPYLATIDSQINVLEKMKYKRIIERFPVMG